MKKLAALVLVVLALLLIFLTSARSYDPVTASACAEPAATPTPYVVPGTEWRGYVVRAKPGYQFVKQEIGVSVVKLRTNAYMGTYICP